MTTIEVSAAEADPIIATIARLGLRLPENQGLPGAASRTLVWTPDLTANEQLIYDAATAAVALTPTEYAEVRAQMQVLRAFRQRNQSDFIALTQNARDRALYDSVVAITEVLLKVLRD